MIFVNFDGAAYGSCHKYFTSIIGNSVYEGLLLLTVSDHNQECRKIVAVKESEKMIGNYFIVLLWSSNLILYVCMPNINL